MRLGRLDADTAEDGNADPQPVLPRPRFNPVDTTALTVVPTLQTGQAAQPSGPPAPQQQTLAPARDPAPQPPALAPVRGPAPPAIPDPARTIAAPEAAGTPE